MTVVEPIKNEKWWGVLSGEGSKMPFVDAQIIDISKTNESNQAASILLSSAGRYIWSAKPFTVEFSEEGVPTITSKYENVAVVKAGKTLREAYLAMSQKYFVNDKISRIDAVLQMPIITISENKTQADVITLCKTLKIKDFGSNIIALNPSWQRYNGALDFDHTSYPSPKEMISEIHSAGGKVMVWVSPFVSADSPTYRDLSKKGYLLLDSSTKRPKLIEWSGGVSAAYDFTNPEASKFFIDKLSKLKSTYSIDGFRFAEGDIDYYATNVKSFLNTATATTHTQAWNNIASNFSMSQIKSSFNSQNLMLAHQLNDAGCTWESIQSIIPNLMAASLMGYPYISVGVENVSDIAPIDEPLIVRLAQLEAA
ncbi:MAG: glycoside hydrolase family 31 protein, partial [Rikenellaceae bacterium]